MCWSWGERRLPRSCTSYFHFACFIFVMSLLSESLAIWDAWYIKKDGKVFTMSRGGSRIFFLGGGALVSCSTSTPINHIVFFFCIIPVVLENRMSSQGGGGAHPLHPPPRSIPDFTSINRNWTYDLPFHHFAYLKNNTICSKMEFEQAN